MEVVKEELNPSTVALTVTVEKERVSAAFQRAFKDLTKHVRVPGFRPGNAPKALLEQYVDRPRVEQRAAELVVSQAYREAIEQEGIEPYASPDIQLEQVAEDAELIFKAKIPLKPEVRLGEYKNISVTRQPVSVTDQEVAAQIEEMRTSKSTWKTVEGKFAAPGDHAVVSLDPLEGGDLQKQTFLIQVGETFGGLDQAVTGMLPGQSKEQTLTFPEDFQDKAWAGKPLDVRITLDSIRAIEAPELNDNFSKQFDVETLEELRDSVRARIETLKNEFADEQLQEDLLTEFMKRSTVIIPDTMWESRAERQVEQVEKDVAREGASMEMYAAQQNMTVDQLRQQVRDDAKNQIMRLVAIQEIAKNENIQVTSEELAEQVQALAHRNGISVQKMRENLQRTDNWDEVVLRAIYKKVLSFLVENAQVTQAAS